MQYIPWIALGVSIVALIISGLSFWNSWRARRSSEDAQHHTQIVTFEQSKQEIRQILLEQELLHEEIKRELDRTPDSDHLRDMIARVAIIRKTAEATIKLFDEVPSSPSTDVRLRLEQVRGTSIESKERLQVLLKALRNENALRGKK